MKKGGQKQKCSVYNFINYKLIICIITNIVFYLFYLSELMLVEHLKYHEFFVNGNIATRFR